MTGIQQLFSIFTWYDGVCQFLLLVPGADGLAKQKKGDINTATEAELGRVPGVSKELAKLIVSQKVP